MPCHLAAGSSASQSYNFKNYYTTSYVLGFYARTPGDGCPLKVTLSGKNITKTFTIGKYERYYAAIVFDRTVASNSGTLKFENLSSDTIIIDNVSLAPVESYEEAVWNGATATQNNKKITRESTCTSSINSDNQVKEETTLDHLTGATLTKVNTYTSDKLYIDKTVSTLKYKENGVERSETETVECASTPTSTATTTTYKAADGSSLKTYVRTETNIYGMPVKEVGVNKDKTYYFYENTQNNLRPVKKIICNNATEIAAGESHDEHTTDYVETYTYNSYGECSQISDGSNTNTVTDYHSGGETLYGGSGQYWKTDVNGFGDPMAIYENGNSVKQIQYEYNGYRQLSKSIYNRSSADMSYADYRYDQYGNVKTIKWYEKNGADAEAVQSADYSNTYDFANLSQTVVTDGVSYVYQANYNNSALKSKIGISGNGYGASYVYNGRADGLLSSSTYTFNNFSNGVLTRTYTPQYNNKKQIVSETDGSNFKSEYTYDAMGRVIKYSVTNNSAEIGYNTYTYATYSSSGVKYALQNVTSCSGTSTGSGSYGYDALGRVNRITTNRSTEETISYDKYNRLSGTTLNGYSGTWYSYKYDANNNLTEIGKRVPNGPPVTQAYATFTYNSKNQLTSYFVKGGTTKYYSYDNLGNPVKYGVSSTGAADNMVWAQGTKLASGSYKGNSFSYKYNADGVRYEKTVNGITTRQYLEGQRVIAEETINESGAVTHAKYYIYDQTGIAGMVYDGQTYYFLKNIFGDVTTIYDSDGQSVESYTYDHWGNITSGGNSGIGYENPFRYRGYYYDNETGFYYLQTRYYDPEICRFISADNLELLPELSRAAGQLNLYAYCGNNPIMNTDENGESILAALLIAAGIIVGGAISGFFAGANASEGESFGSAFLGGFINGVVGGLSLAAGLAVAANGGIPLILFGGAIAVVGGFAGGFLGNAVSQLISYGDVDLRISAIAGSISAGTNFMLFVAFWLSDFYSFAEIFIKRFVANLAIDIIPIALSVYLSSLPIFNPNDFRGLLD